MIDGFKITEFLYEGITPGLLLPINIVMNTQKVYKNTNQAMTTSYTQYFSLGEF